MKRQSRTFLSGTQWREAMGMKQNIGNAFFTYCNVVETVKQVT